MQSEQASYQSLVFFYIHEIMLYLPEVEKLLKEIKRFSIPGETVIKIIVLLDKVSVDPVTHTYVYTYECMELYKKSDGHSGIRNPLPAEIDLTKPDAWKVVFAYILNRFRAKRKIMFTWSHGVGFGINTANDEPPKPVIAKDAYSVGVSVSNDIYFVDKKWLMPGAFLAEKKEWPGVTFQDDFIAIKRSLVPPCNKILILWVQTLNDVLRESLPAGEKIDFLLMVNCNMQLVDNAVILSDTVKHLIASESVFSSEGFNYPALFDTLCTFPDIPDYLLCQEIVTAFKDKYLHAVKGRYRDLQHYTLFAHRLEYTEPLLYLVNQFAGKLIELIENPAAVREIAEIRSSRFGDTSSLRLGFVDFGLLLETFGKQLSFPNPFQLYHRLYQVVLSEMVQASFVGHDFLLSDQYQPWKFGHSGLSICFPENKNDFQRNVFLPCVYYNWPDNSRFAQLSKWDDFLYKLYK